MSEIFTVCYTYNYSFLQKDILYQICIYFLKLRNRSLHEDRIKNNIKLLLWSKICDALQIKTDTFLNLVRTKCISQDEQLSMNTSTNFTHSSNSIMIIYFVFLPTHTTSYIIILYFFSKRHLCSHGEMSFTQAQ